MNARVATPALSPAEELANSITHGVGLALSLVGLGVLIGYAAQVASPSVFAGCLVFGVSLVVLYAASTLYHSFRSPRLKRLWRVVDHAAIYLLIAGTYTPFVLTHLAPHGGLRLLFLVWGLALAGITLKLFFTGRFDRLSTFAYVALGWLAVTELDTLLTAVPAGCLAWVAAGGLCYTGGVVFYLWTRLPYHHAIWHLFVLAGSVCHYFAVVLYLA